MSLQSSPPDQLVVSVEQRHIDEGSPCASCFCPIAKAIQEKYGIHITEVCVWPKLVFVTLVGRYRLPPEAQEFVKRFDKQKPVEPFTFTAKRIRKARKAGGST